MGRRCETGVDLVAEGRERDPEAVVVVCRPGGGVDGVEFGAGLFKEDKESLGLVGVRLLSRLPDLVQLVLEGVEGRDHGAFLLLAGDLDEGALDEFIVAPALVADLLGELVEEQAFVDRRARLADDAAKLLVGVLLLVLESPQGFALFDRGEILPLEILDQGDLGGVSLHADRRNHKEARNFGRCVTALAGDDDQVGIALFHPEEQRLKDAVARERRGQILQGLRIHVLPGLVGVGLKINDGDLIKLAFFVSRGWVCHDVPPYLLSVRKLTCSTILPRSLDN